MSIYKNDDALDFTLQSSKYERISELGKVIGIDVEGTLAPAFTSVDKIGPISIIGFSVLQKFKQDGHVVCLFSCKPKYLLEQWVIDNNLQPFVDYCNASPIPTDGEKPCFDVYIGDEAMNWDQIYDNPDYWCNYITTGLTTPERYFRDTNFCDRPMKLFYQGTGKMFMQMFKDHWKQFWPKSKQHDIAFMTTCSHAKPYGKSHIHCSIRHWLFELGILNKVDYIHISGAGITSTETGYEYPYCAYDGDYSQASDEIRHALRDKIAADLSAWYEICGKDYKHIVIYLRLPSLTLGAVMASIAKHQNVEIILAQEKILPWLTAENHDPDNGLIHVKNLTKLNFMAESLGSVE
jgi:hypothetical protein